jgi:hypothetical protein
MSTNGAIQRSHESSSAPSVALTPTGTATAYRFVERALTICKIRVGHSYLPQASLPVGRTGLIRNRSRLGSNPLDFDYLVERFVQSRRAYLQTR